MHEAPPAAAPSSRARLAVAAGIVALAGGLGLLAGQSTGDDEATSPAVAPEQKVEAAPEYEPTLRRVLEPLAAARLAELQRLREAATPARQASKSADVARGYQRSANRLAGSEVPASIRREHRSLIAALRNAAGAYRRLGAAAARGDRTAYLAGRRAVRRAEARLGRQLAATLKAAESQPL